MKFSADLPLLAEARGMWMWSTANPFILEEMISLAQSRYRVMVESGQWNGENRAVGLSMHNHMLLVKTMNKNGNKRSAAQFARLSDWRYKIIVITFYCRTKLLFISSQCSNGPPPMIHSLVQDWPHRHRYRRRLGILAIPRWKSAYT